MIDGLAKEHNLTKEQVAGAVEKAIMTASRKAVDAACDLTVKVDLSTGELKAWGKYCVADPNREPESTEISFSEAMRIDSKAQPGDIVTKEIPPTDLGRIVAQIARQNVTQQINDLCRELAIDEYKDKIDQIVTGVVRRVDNRGILVDLGRATGLIPPNERVPFEMFRQNDDITVLLQRISDKQSESTFILSRKSARFLRRLFEREISEIHDGIVEIYGIVRDAGDRSKVAVYSHDSRIDPKGACVGPRGMRIRAITDKLNKERIDVIQYSRDPKEFITEAMCPAKLIGLDVNTQTKEAVVYVDQENYSLAVGKKAQNIRLASKITGYKISVKIPETDEELFQKDKMVAVANLAEQLDIPQEVAEAIVNKGYLTMEGLLRITDEELNSIEGLTEEQFDNIMQHIGDYRNSKTSKKIAMDDNSEN